MEETPNTGNAILDTRIARLTGALRKDYLRFNNASGYIDVYYRKGKKYLRIFTDTSGQRSVHAFVDLKTGALYKPSSISVPAKHARYQLLDNASFDCCLQRADWAGGYLYNR